MKALASSRPAGGMIGSAVEPHSLGKCLFLHLAPGIAKHSSDLAGICNFVEPVIIA